MIKIMKTGLKELPRLIVKPIRDAIKRLGANFIFFKLSTNTHVNRMVIMIKKLTTIIGNDMSEKSMLNGLSNQSVKAIRGNREPGLDIFLIIKNIAKAAPISNIVLSIIVASHGSLTRLIAKPRRP